MNIKVGGHYLVRHSWNVIRIDAVSPFGGWEATNLKTGRAIYIKSARKLHSEVVPNDKTDKRRNNDHDGCG